MKHNNYRQFVTLFSRELSYVTLNMDLAYDPLNKFLLTTYTGTCSRKTFVEGNRGQNATGKSYSYKPSKQCFV